MGKWTASSITVIIPTFNESSHVKALLVYLRRLNRKMELMVSDGGSTDGTSDIAKPLAGVLRSRKGRGAQMNAGAAIADGEILWFLHADCHPHPDSIEEMLRALGNPAVAGGGFEYDLDHPGLIFRLTEFFSNRKNRLLKLLYGDMGIFVRKEVFEKMGGFKEIPLMEDMDFCKRLKKHGKIIIIPKRISTSAKRWIEEGAVKNLVRNWLLQIAWSLGASPDALSKHYKFK
jgi:rSAM/selenodomain-associated transferase 2